jgi:hypothetical protein
MSEDRTSPADGALFAINMLVGTQGGGTYTFNEIKQGLSQAGFTDIKQLGGESMFSLVEGYKMGQGKKC